MFRVPSDPNAPTFDQTFTVGFVKWLTSNAEERKEWLRRRNAAAQTAAADQARRFNEYAEGKKQHHRDEIERIQRDKL